ncbi:MAG: hypothetical protein NXI22_25705, partial [bacterium]|nr:hypothetical protein [bacterium]
MTYARSRLWLGISGVGFLVVLALGSLIAQIPYRLLPHEETWGAADLLSLFLVSLLTVAIMIPFDLLGGWILPTRFNLNSQNLLDLAGKWLLGVAVQSAVYVLTALAILGAGRAGGDYAAMGVVALLTFSFLFIQESIVGLLTRRSRNNEDLPEKTRQALRDWGYKEPKVSFYRHEDRGFTGGVAGLPGSETIILPESWLDSLGPEQLAITVARRLEAIATGSRS